MNALRHPDCRACAERERLSLGQLAQIRQLKQALAEDRGKWGFDTLLAVGDALLADLYPEGIPLISEGDDPGPRLVRALRDCRQAMDFERAGA
jgi:hypothetical protein